jgi:hypothetical protein
MDGREFSFVEFLSFSRISDGQTVSTRDQKVENDELNFRRDLARPFCG